MHARLRRAQQHGEAPACAVHATACAHGGTLWARGVSHGACRAVYGHARAEQLWDLHLYAHPDSRCRGVPVADSCDLVLLANGNCGWRRARAVAAVRRLWCRVRAQHSDQGTDRAGVPCGHGGGVSAADAGRSWRPAQDGTTATVGRAADVSAAGGAVAYCGRTCEPG